MIRKTFKKTRRFKKGLKGMFSGGFGKRGPYAYAGIKTKKGVSMGASFGTQGTNLYGGVNKKYGQARVKYNVETKSVTPRLGVNKRNVIKQLFGK